jgi:hypothetical protein
MEYSVQTTIGNFTTTTGISFNVIMTERGPIAELPMNQFNFQRLTDLADGVDFQVCLGPLGPIAKVPLLQLHMGRLQYLKEILHPDALKSLVYASDPDPIMRTIFENDFKKISYLANSDRLHNLHDKYLRRALKLNVRAMALALAMYGCPSTKETREELKTREWNDVLNLL